MSRPPRLRAFSYVGPARYFLTFCTHHRGCVLTDTSVAELVMLQFRRTAQQEGFLLLAYCLMPDHAHFLVEGTTERSDLKRFMKLAKQRSGGLYTRRTGQLLWQEGFYDHVLREDEDIKAIARYIVANPVRAGLVRGASEYPHIGSDVWSMAELLDGI